mmetsp:Transcript_12193/g.30451  ORF Transcript_12193/g.30451 Transcript_12193/m.30451 type:complete len:201 (-) Transcript_12193:417-1019(-)
MPLSLFFKALFTAVLAALTTAPWRAITPPRTPACVLDFFRFASAVVDSLFSTTALENTIRIDAASSTKSSSVLVSMRISTSSENVEARSSLSASCSTFRLLTAYRPKCWLFSRVTRCSWKKVARAGLRKGGTLDLLYHFKPTVRAWDQRNTRHTSPCTSSSTISSSFLALESSSGVDCSKYWSTSMNIDTATVRMIAMCE